MTMSERWKPFKGERYWYVSNVCMTAEDCWDGFSNLDEERYNAGNCFKTEEDAGIAAVKVKTLLRSLSDNGNNLVTDLPDKKLPKWVEIGGYVYDPRNGYGKIVSGSVKACYIEFDGGAGVFVPEAFAELKQARLRPYNTEELSTLVGKIVCEGDGTGLLLVTAYNAGDDVEPPEPAIMTLSDWTTASELLNNGYTIDGKPCGVFEHRNDAGEWVE